MNPAIESASASTPFIGSYSGQSTRSRSSTKLDDVTSLTSFNPFAEEDENDQAPYTFTSILSRVKNTFSAPLVSTVTTTTTSSTTRDQNIPANSPATEQRRPSYTTTPSQNSVSSTKSVITERPFAFSTAPAQAAPPLVSLTPAQSETPTFTIEYDPSITRRNTSYSPVYEAGEGASFGTSIPGFPIQDDARSIRTTTSLHRSGSVSKVMRRIRGEGLSRDYWMDDENCRECYDCKSVFTAWRRKHHCRICGQIFCSRCAYNIIKGTRFGQNGMIRVCNLCLEKLAKVDEDDEDDRRSVVSSVTFPAHQFGVDTLSGFGHPQSPFAASQLFGRTDEPFNLYSIAETRKIIYGSEGNGAGPIALSFPQKDDPGWGSVLDNPAPFRRALSDEEERDQSPVENFASEVTVAIEPPLPSAEPSNTAPINIQGTTNFIQFPASSPERNSESPQPNGHRLQPSTDPEMATPFIRSRVQSRIDTLSSATEPGWRTRRESTAYAQELNLTSMMHLKIMLRQMLLKEQIPNIKEWEEALLKLAMRIARELTFTSLPYRQGEDMDVRRYVKIKKIPGGRPCDSEYVNGAVITKNVAHKQMSRLQNNPRIMLVTFPLEFYRVEGQYMQFGQILRQEKEYLGNLASRISALRPHVVLVEKTVSRLALEDLAEHNIAVARNVKPSAIATIARMTQGDEFSSIDKLALEPRLGHCTRFRIQTYDHGLIPGRRKTYMRFEGCNSDLGCTIILRGGNIETLQRIKKVTRFLTFIVRNLKLETHLWKDSVITLPSFNPEALPVAVSRSFALPKVNTAYSFPQSVSLSTPRLATPVSGLPDVFSSLTLPKIEDSETDDLPNEDAEQLRLSRRIEQSLEPYRSTFISVSATLRFPPPYPIKKMKELDDALQASKRAWEDDVVLREEKAQSKSVPEVVVSTPDFPPTSLEDTGRADINAQIEALNVPIPPSPEFTPHFQAMLDEGSYFAGVSPTPPASEITSSVVLQPLIEEPYEPIKTAADIALQSKYRHLQWKHEEHRRIWEWCLRKNADDFVVEKYQQILLWEYTIPTSEIGQRRSCFAPQLTYLQFYGENDMTLGQFIEKAVVEALGQLLDPKATCAGKGCDQPSARHCRVYVHNETRLFVAVEQWEGQIVNHAFEPAPDLITTWSACRVCGSATPFIPVSPEMQRYSFAKFLELHFYPADVKLVQGAGCEHNIYQHHIRFFASRGMTVRFQTDPVIMHEVVYPPFRIHVRPETQLDIKNTDFEKLHKSNFTWYSNLIDELRLISIDAATGDEEADARLNAEVNVFIARAEAEREEISRLISKTYRESAPTDTLALNHVHAFRQDKIVALQQDFDRLPKPKPATMIDRGSKRTSAFNTVRIWPQKPNIGLLPDHSSSSILPSEAEEGPFIKKRLDPDPFASSASDISEPELEAEPQAPELEKLPENCADTEPVRGQEEQPSSITTSDAPDDSNYSDKLDEDSDSTIGARRSDARIEGLPKDENPAIPEPIVSRMSRLPRRSVDHPSVAELVRKYQDFIPPQSISDLAKSALPPRPVVSESEQEYPSTIPRRPIRRGRHSGMTRKSSVSDFESSYAANVAPRYLMHSRRSANAGSRIPGPSNQLSDSHESSRKASPEKRPSYIKGKEIRFSRPSSPPNVAGRALASIKQPKNRISGRVKDKATSRPPGMMTKSTLRRPPGPNTKVMTLAKNFERLGREAERTKGRYNIIRGKRARPVASARAIVEVLDSVKDALRDDMDSDSSSEADDEGDGIEYGPSFIPPVHTEVPPTATVPETSGDTAESEAVIPSDVVPVTTPLLPTFPEHPNKDNTRPPLPATAPPESLSLPPSPLFPPVRSDVMTSPASDLELPPSTGQSIFRALSEFWQPSRHPIELDDPMSDPEHIFRDSSMIVRTDEPTSIIALALNSPQYRDMLAKSRAEKKTAREPKLTEGEVFMPDDKSIAESTSTWGVVNVDSADSADPTEDLRLPSSRLPWAISFESGGLTISCTILYPEQFDALRRTYDCEKSMVESLSRCVKWNASGGKSGSAFLKTRDDRFIAKELSKFEVQTMETFAPAYFDYMSSAVSANRPTLLAKVFGCYNLTFRKTGKGKGTGKFKSTQMNLLVMENLFYDRRFTKIYDLKGSTRNRHVQSTGRENEVLLDENLVQTAHLNPFYLREHSKRILRGALYNDSRFLADINVMDYSLVCGVDNQNNELVVGIVDYIRTYTWDKKLESWVKEWGAGKEPTIVTPKQYRQRFISAMERYFPLIPDRWMKQRDTPEEDPNVLSELWPDW
ncbi:hypothetical protein P691DRAFT_724173 [Macrolepiota fuliginosa MF-IS2]|uniref:1-phosphatidylinositol-3-phosphate 5-kinase n=1 Tax=Macrolepiota fuliginosa MF-IS2 TaxID=1400762 RepID=A0A9P5XKF9_9AGAR|nr:hypothetical protein P691DRAFT_724173 [Macrolepiota fuliginosa MF-IS2]